MKHFINIVKIKNIFKKNKKKIERQWAAVCGETDLFIVHFLLFSACNIDDLWKKKKKLLLSFITRDLTPIFLILIYKVLLKVNLCRKILCFLFTGNRPERKKGLLSIYISLICFRD